MACCIFSSLLVVIEVLSRIHLFSEILLYQPNANRMVEILVLLKSLHRNLTVNIFKSAEPIPNQYDP
jgi:hypothetical protein